MKTLSLVGAIRTMPKSLLFELIGSQDLPLQHERPHPVRRPTDLARAVLNEMEIALLELPRAPEIYIETGWADFATRVREAVQTGKGRESELRSAVATEHNAAARTNFGQLENTALVSAT